MSPQLFAVTLNYLSIIKIDDINITAMLVYSERELVIDQRGGCGGGPIIITTPGPAGVEVVQ